MKLRNGNQLVAEAAVYSGCRFFAGYPITPASGIYKSMIELLQVRGDAAVSSPDEISALAYCVGASMRGFKAMTATSGPGWALMSETVQYALMTETPVVIALVQRLGPSTGGATQGAQGDVLLAEFSTSGGYTIPMFCPSTPRQCFELTVHAFNWSEILRTPVVLLLDKEVGMTTESVDTSLFTHFPLVDRVSKKHLGEKTDSLFKTYDFQSRDDVPVFFPVGDTIKVTATGSAHNKAGELKKNDEETLEVLYHLEEKILTRANELTILECDLQPSAETLIISYGITARTVREVVRRLRSDGKKISYLNLLTLFPIPEKHLLEAATNASHIVVAEENMKGQYRQVIQHLFTEKEVIGINKIGSMITPQEIIQRIPL